MFVAYRRDPDIARYQSWAPDYDMAMAEVLVAGIEGHEAGGRRLSPPPGAWRQLAIIEGATETLVGDAALHTLAAQPDTYEIGITLAANHHGRGLAAEALGLVLDALFTSEGAHRVIAHSDERNDAVHRLLEALGLRLEGRFLDADWCKGEWTTLRLYAVLASEWRGGLRRTRRP